MATGDNRTGQLGLGDIVGKNRFTPVPDINNCKQIVCAYYYTMILLNDGIILATGNNTSGELGLGDNIKRNIFTEVPLDVGKTGFYDIE